MLGREYVAAGGKVRKCIAAVAIGCRRLNRACVDVARRYGDSGNRGAGRVGHRTGEAGTIRRED